LQLELGHLKSPRNPAETEGMKTILLSAAALLATACVQNVGSFGTMAPHMAETPSRVIQRSVEGRDCMHMVLFVPMGKLNPRLDMAMKDALNKVPAGDRMTDVEVNTSMLFTYLYNRQCMTVKGDVRGPADGAAQR
jgi:hypothetical protein